MTRMDEDPGKRRGTGKPRRGARALNELTVNLVDFTWGSFKKPTNLYHPKEIKGYWFSPKKGFIQWKMMK